MTVKRMDNVGIVVADLDAAVEHFVELGHELEGRATRSVAVGLLLARAGGARKRAAVASPS